MTPLSVFLLLALLAAVACAAVLFARWQAVTHKLHQAEKELAAAQTPQDLEDRFKVLSQEFFDRYGEKAEKGISTVLTPVRDEVAEFKRRVNELVDESRATKLILGEKFSNMDETVSKLSNEAKDLADALRGDSKMRGDWGETALKRILESVGLRENESYFLQRSYDVEGGRLRPDAVLRLPDRREVAIDAKVSLVAYDEYARAQDDERRAKAARDLLAAVERQVEETAKYNAITDAQLLGFTFMFMPVEPAWILLMSEHPQLLANSQRKGVIITCPSNLMVALKIVDQMWLAEHKVRNMTEVFAVAGRVVDAVQRLVVRVDRTRKQLDTASDTLDEVRVAIDGKQGALPLARRLQEFGGRGKKPLPEAGGSDGPDGGDPDADAKVVEKGPDVAK